MEGVHLNQHSGILYYSNNLFLDIYDPEYIDLDSVHTVLAQ